VAGRLVADAADGADDIFLTLILLPARSSRLKAVSMPSARRKVCARRGDSEWAGIFLPDGHRNAFTAAVGRRPAEGRHELRSAIILRPRVGPSIGRVGARVNAHRPWCAVGGAGTWTIAHACHPTDAV